MEDHNWRPSWVVVALVDIVEIHTVDEGKGAVFSVFSATMVVTTARCRIHGRFSKVVG